MPVKTYNLTISGEAKISQNFKVKEFRSYSSTYNKLYSNEVKISTELVAMLEKLRTFLGGKIVIINGYRSPAHNKAVGGSSNSTHLKGYAADICCYDASGKVISAKKVCCVAEDLGFSGIGYMRSNHVHVDMSPSRIWRGDETKKENGTYYSLTRHGLSFYKYFNIKEKYQPYKKPVVTKPQIDYSVPSDWAADIWKEATNKGWTDGTNPRKDVTREQAITLIYRVIFNKPNETIENSVNICKEKKYTDGTNMKNYATREQVVALIYRMYKNNPDATLEECWTWGIESKITDGTVLKNNCTREQVIVMLDRVINLSK